MLCAGARVFAWVRTGEEAVLVGGFNVVYNVGTEVGPGVGDRSGH